MVLLNGAPADDVVKGIGGRAHTYEWLATVLRRPISRLALRQLRQASVLEALRNAGVNLGSDFSQRPEDDLLDDLAVDYTQIFDGPRADIPPYESIQGARNESALNGHAAARVRSFVEGNGLQLKETYRQLPDHISVELEIMSVLLRLEADAWQRMDGDEALQQRARQRAFFEAHIGQWGPNFGRRIEAKANTRFYKAMGGLLSEFLELEKSENLNGNAIDMSLRPYELPT